MFFVKLFHLKIRMFGDKELEKNGKVIPCIGCGTTFKSYCRYRGTKLAYHAYCSTCKLLTAGGII